MQFGYYVPLDEILSAPMTRILRALRRFDWADREDLWEALGYDLHYVESSIRAVIAQTLLRLIREGLVECRYHGGPVRITAAGRSKLEDLLKYDVQEPANANGTNQLSAELSFEERRQQSNIRYRARLVAEGKCVLGRNHGPATHGQMCHKCHERRTAQNRTRTNGTQGRR